MQVCETVQARVQSSRTVQVSSSNSIVSELSGRIGCHICAFRTENPLMRPDERFNLITAIALQLQRDMSTSEINVYLGGFGVQTNPVSIVDSKRLYVMELLKEANDRLLVRIATGLDVDVPNNAGQGAHELADYLSSGGLEAAYEDFGRALDSIDSDPAQAIASSSSTLESICKAILDRCGEEYPSDESLQPLVKAVCKVLDLSPEGRADADIKRVLGGLQNAAFGIAVLRTKFSSAHGRGASQHRYKLGPRHARLAVNAAATVAYFLIETYHEKFD